MPTEVAPTWENSTDVPTWENSRDVAPTWENSRDETATATTPQPSPLAQGINEQNKTAFETYTKAMEMLGTGLAAQRITNQREAAKVEQELSIQPVGTGSEPLTLGTPTQSKEESLVPTAREFAAWATMPLIPLEGAGQVATRLGQDIVSKIMGDPQYGGNLRAWIEKPDQQSPAEKFIADAAKSSPHMAVLANLGKQASEMSPMLGIGAAPGLAGRAVSAGFASTMGISLYDAAKELNRQLGLPADQQNAGLIAELKATLVTTGVFGALASTHAVTGRSPIDLTKSGFEAMKPEITPKPSTPVTYRRPGEGTPFPKAGEARPEPQAIQQPTVMPFSATPPTTTPPEQRVTDETVFNEALARQQALQAEINAKTLAPLTTAETSKTTEVPNARSITSTKRIPGTQVRPGVDEGAPLRQQGETPVPQTEVLAPQTEKAVKEIVQPEDVSGGVLGKPAEPPSPQVHEEAAQPPPSPPAPPVGTEAGKAVPEWIPGESPPSKVQEQFKAIEQRYRNGTPSERMALDLISDNEFATRRYDPSRMSRQGVTDESLSEAHDRLMKESGLAWSPPSPTPEPPASQKPSPPAPTSEGKGKKPKFTEADMNMDSGTARYRFFKHPETKKWVTVDTKFGEVTEQANKTEAVRNARAMNQAEVSTPPPTAGAGEKRGVVFVKSDGPVRNRLLNSRQRREELRCSMGTARK